MIRKTLTILSLIGLLLSVGAWGVSYFLIYYQGTQNEMELVLGVFEWLHRPLNSQISGWHVEGLVPPKYLEIKYVFPRFRWVGSGSSLMWRATIPLWIPTLFFAIMSWVMHAPVHRRRKRKKLGLCLKCGYDLRASKGRCPECGEEF